MTIQIKYIDGGIGVEIIGSGVVTGADIIAANKEIYRNENFYRQRYQIVDRTKCTKYEVSHKEIIIVAEQDKVAAKTNPNIIIAFISTSPLQYGISRMYQAYVGDEGFLTEVFRDRKSAEKWIKEQLKKQLKILFEYKAMILNSANFRKSYKFISSKRLPLTLLSLYAQKTVQ